MPVTSPLTSMAVSGRSSRRISLASSVTVYGRCASSGRNMGGLAYGSDRAQEVERRDAHPLVEVQAVGVRAVRADAGIKVELVAAEALGLIDHPVHQLARVTLAAMLEPRCEVIAVKGAAPREHVDDAKARGCSRLNVVLDEEADHAVTLWPLDRVDTLDENRLGADVRPQLEHRLIDQVGRPRMELLNHPPI